LVKTKGPPGTARLALKFLLIAGLLNCAIIQRALAGEGAATREFTLAYFIIALATNGKHLRAAQQAREC
jgi:hypothetical protein